MRIGLVAPDPIELPDGTVRCVERLASFDDALVERVWASQELGSDAMVVMTAVAARTTRIGLGTAIVPVWPRHPFLMAQEALTLQALSGGRFVLGVGVSHAQFMEPLGFAYRAPVSFVEDYLRVLVPVTHHGEVDHVGPHFRVRASTGMRQVAPVPVLLAALGPRMLELGGRLADGIVTFLASPTRIAAVAVPIALEAAASSDRPRPHIVAAVQVCVTERPRAVKELVRERMAPYARRPAYRRLLESSGVQGPEELLVAGPMEVVAQNLEAYRRAGVDELIIEPVLEDSTAPESWAEVRDWVPELGAWFRD